MNRRIALMALGAIIFGFGISSDLGIRMLPVGLGFLIFVIGLCIKNKPKPQTIGSK